MKFRDTMILYVTHLLSGVQRNHATYKCSVRHAIIRVALSHPSLTNYN